jgi:hypothetical protein
MVSSRTSGLKGRTREAEFALNDILQRIAVPI